MKIKRLLSAFLAGAVVLGSMAIPAFADETETTEETYVAQVGSNKYETLQAAFDAANENDTVSIIADFSLEQTAKITDKTITIDLGGHTVDATKIPLSNAGILIERVSNETNVTFMGTGTINGNENCITNDGGAVTINGGMYTGKSIYYNSVSPNAVLYNKKGTMNVNSGVSVKSSYFALLNNDICNIKGAALESDAYSGRDKTDPRPTYAYAVKNSGTMQIFDGTTVKGIQGALVASGGGILDVFGGTFETAKKDGARGWHAFYAANTSYAVIYGGKFNSAEGNAVLVSDEDQGKDGASVIIKGGEFTSAQAAAAVKADIAGNLKITGGTFSSDVSSYVPSDICKIDNTDGKCAITENNVAKIGENEYKTLEEAVAAVSNGATITLLHNAGGNGIQSDGRKDFTIDFNGCTYTIDGATVGSSTTETNGFQLLKSNDSTPNITFKNGKITSNRAYMAIQNYSNLTLEDMTVELTTTYSMAYTLSNNNGNTVFKGNTNIIASKNANYSVAFDVCRFSSYTDGVTVTLDETMTGTIDGDVEFSNDEKANNVSYVAPSEKFNLFIKNGTIIGKIIDARKGDQKNVPFGVVTGGKFSDSSIGKYLAKDYTTEEADGLYNVVNRNENFGKVAVLTGEKADNGNPLLTLFTGINYLDYKNAGFKVEGEGIDKEVTTTVVYTGVKVGNAGEITPASFGNGKFIFGAKLEIDKDTYAGKTLKITPFATTLKGEKVEGTPTTVDVKAKTVQDGEDINLGN